MMYEINDNNQENEQHGLILDNIVPDIRWRKPFPTYLFSTTKAVEVQCIPNNTDHFKLYKIHATDKNWTRVTSHFQYLKLLQDFLVQEKVEYVKGTGCVATHPVLLWTDPRTTSLIMSTAEVFGENIISRYVKLAIF